MKALEDQNQSFIKVSYVFLNLDPITNVTSCNSILACSALPTSTTK